MYWPAWLHADDLSHAADVEVDPTPDDKATVTCRHIHDLKGGGTGVCDYRGPRAEFELAAATAAEDAVAGAGSDGRAAADAAGA